MDQFEIELLNDQYKLSCMHALLRDHQFLWLYEKSKIFHKYP